MAAPRSSVSIKDTVAASGEDCGGDMWITGVLRKHFAGRCNVEKASVDHAVIAMIPAPDNDLQNVIDFIGMY
jgi:hypothetical protein